MSRDGLTQREFVLRKLRAHEELTPFVAFAAGITRLSAIIYDLRQEGFTITDLNAGIPLGNQGRSERYSDYHLISEPGEAQS